MKKMDLVAPEHDIEKTMCFRPLQLEESAASALPKHILRLFCRISGLRSIDGQGLHYLERCVLEYYWLCAVFNLRCGDSLHRN